MGYIPFIRSNLRFLCFGFFLVFVGNYGQTFFISVFGGELRQAFSLDHTQYSFYYSLATLISGFSLMLIGGRLDTSSLRQFTIWVLVGTLAATLVMATAVSVWMLFLGFLMIRFCGQGLTGHTAFTSMARYYDANRGKAISTAAMGMPVGELILPLAAAASIAAFGWRETWLILAALLVCIFVPVILWSLGDARVSQPIEQASASASPSQGKSSDGQSIHWTRGQVIKDQQFWFALLAILAPAAIITGVFFHQVFWAESRGWSLAALASSMVLYGVTHALGSLFTGTLVDRLGAFKVLRFYLLPLFLATVCLLSDSFIGWLAFMFLAGFSVGASGPVIGSLWPEVYGTRHLGAIRSLVSAIMVLSTAITPIALGIMIDQQISIRLIMMILMTYAFAAWMICQWIYRRNPL